MQSLSVLLIEDNDEHANIITRYLRRAGDTEIQLVREDLLVPGLQRVENEFFDVLLLDLRLPDSDIDETLSRVTAVVQRTPIVVLSTLEDRDLAIRTVHQGAQDFLVKSDLNSDLLIRAIFSAMERKQTETKLKNQMAQNLVLFQLSHQAVLDQDISSTIRTAISEVGRTLEMDFVDCVQLNPGTVKELGISADILNSRSVIEIPQLRESSFFAHYSLLHQRELTSGLNLAIPGKAGKPQAILIGYSLKTRQFSSQEISFFEAVGNILASSFIRTQLESEVLRTIENLKIANTRKDEFLATLSHELRTPLNVICGNLELLNSSEKGSAEYSSALEAIHRNLELETKLVTDTLEMSLLISGKFILDLQEFSFDDLIESLILSLRPLAEAKHIALEIQGDKNIGKLNADPARLRQALSNIISNALKFNVEGGQVVIETHKEADFISITIRDNGEGIDPENIQNVFQRFWQEESSANRRFMGLGLGLALVRHIIELHGGSVKVESGGKGRGSSFTLRLPFLVQDQRFKKAPVQSALAASPVQEPKKRSELLQGIQILLVDDSEDTLVLMKRLLERDGAQVSSFISPVMGLAAAKENIYDLIISDIGMPDLDGYELMRLYRDWEKDNGRSEIPAIALTAYVTDEDIQKAKSVGYQVHMTKPMNIRHLETTILNLHGVH